MLLFKFKTKLVLCLDHLMRLIPVSHIEKGIDFI